MNKIRNYIPIIFALVVSLTACSKDDGDQTPVPTPPPTDSVPENKISFSILYNVDGQPIIRDSIMYFNDAGNHYSIYNLLYYLSEISIIKSDGTVIQVKDIQYVDCFDPATNLFTITSIPEGEYTGIRFNIGIDSAHNDHSVLPVTQESLNMEWPEPMGGGFHFLRLEGSFTDAGNSYGYAMHIGTNACLIPSIALNANFTVTNDSHTSLTLKMNVNEWYRNPNIYDFNIDGNYTMGDLPLMMKITENGQDVFTF